MKMRVWTLALAALTACGSYAQAGVILFADDFSNGAVGAPVSINAPDPIAPNPETVADNSSVSGYVLQTFGPDQRPWVGDNAGPGTLGGEVGGVASWSQAGTGTNSGTISPNYNFALNSFVQTYKEFTVVLEDLNPVLAGGGTSGNWVGVSLFRPLPANGGGTDVNNSAAGFGILIRDNGKLQLFAGGANFQGDTVFDATPTDEAYDVEVKITNISAFGLGSSFDYDVIVDGNSIASGTRTNVNTTNAFVSLESRTNSSSIGGIIVSTIPEPSSVALAGLALVGLVAAARRRN